MRARSGYVVVERVEVLERRAVHELVLVLSGTRQVQNQTNISSTFINIIAFISWPWKHGAGLSLNWQLILWPALDSLFRRQALNNRNKAIIFGGIFDRSGKHFHSMMQRNRRAISLK